MGRCRHRAVFEPAPTKIQLTGTLGGMYTHIHMKRTSLNIENTLMEQVSKEARLQNITQTELIKLILVQGLKALKIRRKKVRLDIPVVSGDGLVPGVDLSDRSGLFDLLIDKKV